MVVTIVIVWNRIYSTLSNYIFFRDITYVILSLSNEIATWIGYCILWLSKYHNIKYLNLWLKHLN